MSHALDKIYAHRFSGREDERAVLWRTLVDHEFQRYIRPDDAVLDLGAGYCEFINSVRCGKKYAIDLNPDVERRAAPDVTVHHTASTSLPPSLEGSVDVVWISNFLEHLDDKHELFTTLREVHRVLRPGGRVMVLQPNIRLIGGAYWDFVDHSLPITDRSLREALELTGFEIQLLKTRFLPYTNHSRLPASPALIRLYLRFKPAQLLLGKQTFAIATRA